MFDKINHAVDTVRNGLDAQVALATAEQKEQLADAKLALADLKEALANLKEDNFILKRQNDLSDKIKLSGRCYELDMGDGRSRAICMKCWEDDGKAMSLNNSSGSPVCTRCKNFYEVNNEDNFVNLAG